MSANLLAKPDEGPLLRAAPRRPVRCVCGFVLFDGDVLKARVVRILVAGAEAKCRCKRWQAVPLRYDAQEES